MKLLKAAFLSLFLATMAAAQSVPQIKHIIVVPFENHSYSQVIGNSAMPYFNQLASQHGLATQFYAQAHPSMGNYFRLTTGQTITTSDSYTSTVTVDNVVREALAAGKSWKNYAESEPYEGYDGSNAYPYIEHHNPATYFSDVRGSSAQRAHLNSLADFQNDLANNTLPSFAMLVPNNHHNGHDCPVSGTTCTDYDKLRAADSWLQTYVSPLVDNSTLMQDTLVILWWDEGASTDTAYGGGHTATVLISPLVKSNYKSSTFYRDDNLLKTIGEALGFKAYPGNSANVSPMSDFFTSTTAPPPTGSGTLAGKVVNASTGGAVGGATVYWTGGSTTTGSTGSFTLTGLPAGTDAIFVKASGFIPESYPEYITSGATTTATLKLATGGKIAGTVKNSSGSEIAASVKFAGGVIYNSGSVSNGSTGFHTNWIPVGTYTVTVSASGYSSQSKSVTVSTGGTVSLNFTL